MSDPQPRPSVVLYALRAAFALLSATVIVLYVLAYQVQRQVANFDLIVAMTLVAVAVVVGAILLDIGTPKKKLAAVSGIFLGLIAGLLAAYALSFVIDLIGVLFAPTRTDSRAAFLNLLQGVKVVIGLITCYFGMSLVLQTKDDFRFVIPYVEFAKQIRGPRPTLLDTSVIVDGRVVDVAKTGVLQGPLVVPRFVLEELQTIADAGDKLKRARGRRGLDVLKRLQELSAADVSIEDHDASGAGVDQQLIALAEELKARVMTNDFNLQKVAALRNVEVINLNSLAAALKPVVLPGERIEVDLLKPGESPGQGVGYLEDGTMVVVEEGRKHIGHRVDLEVTSTLQTSAGRMIFGRYRGETNGDAAPDTPAPPADADDTDDAPPPARPADHAPPRHSGSRRNPRRG